MIKKKSDYIAEVAALTEKLAQSNAERDYNKTLIDNLPGLIFINEAFKTGDTFHMKNVWANQMAYDYTSYTRQETDDMGEDFGKIVLHPDDVDIMFLSLAYLFKKENIGESYGGLYRIKIRSGEYRWGIGYARALELFTDGVQYKFLNVFVPLTEELKYSKRVTAFLAELRKNAKETIEVKITKTEMNVLKLVCEGYSPDIIADKLFISKRTVEGHIYSLTQKFGLRSITSLAIYAISEGLV